MRHYLLAGNERRDLCPDACEVRAEDRLFRADAVNVYEAAPVVITGRPYQQLYFFGDDTVFHAYQAHLADTVGIAVSGFEVDGRKVKHGSGMLLLLQAGRELRFWRFTIKIIAEYRKQDQSAAQYQQACRRYFLQVHHLAQGKAFSDRICQ